MFEITDDLPRLTDTQAKVIYQVAREHGYGVNKSFAPLELYPNTTRTDHEARRALQEMTGMGLIDLVPTTARGKCELRHVVQGLDGRIYRLKLTEIALMAYGYWARREQ